MKKRYITLLELLIAIALTSIILSSLTFFYRQIVYMDTKADEIQSKNFQQRMLESRLSAILPKALSEKDFKKDFFFFTTSDTQNLFKNGSPSLVFSYDNGIDIEKEFSNNVLGRLYLDKTGNLTLATWPIPRRWQEGGKIPMKKQILSQDVDGLKFSFFIPPETEGKKHVQPEEIKLGKEKAEPLPKGGWTDRWLKEYQQLPGIIKIEVKKGDTSTIYAYPLPHANPPITFKK